MGIYQSFMLALKSLLNNKMRAFLTMLGIIIGVGSVILIMSLGNGMTTTVSDSFESIGTQNISVTLTGRGSSTRTVSVDDMYEFASENTEIVKAMSPTVSSTASVKVPGDSDTLGSTVTGVGEDYLTVKTWEMGEGRFIEYIDIYKNKKVCVVGAYLNSEEVYAGEALGSNIKINGENYRIIGVLGEISDATDEDGSDNCVVVPYSTASRKLSRNANISSYTFLATSKDTVQDLKKALNNELYGAYGSDSSYSVIAYADILDTINEVMDTMVIVIAAIAGISLLVGGIGIMNIMLVSVTERTREIGIRKALGAKKGDIKLQFVIEAMTTSLIGGLIGLAVGVFGAGFAGDLLGMQATPSVGSVALAVGISVGIGVLFGYLPANKAANLNPIDALRYE